MKWITLSLCIGVVYALPGLSGTGRAVQEVFHDRNTTSQRTITYETVPGYFLQDEPTFNGSLASSLPPRFGLIDNSTHRWETLRRKIDELNISSRRNEVFKLIFLVRHGEGYHNVAEAFYGSKAWDDYWSRLNGNGTITWGPDGEISPLGVKQAEKVHDLWKRESYAHIPIPTRVFSSPLSRAAHTLRITFSGLMDLQKHPPMIMEGLRERIGVHTCDLRSSKSEIHRAFPEFVFEDGFVEEDVLWKADVREKDDEKDARLKTVLDSIFTIEDTYVAIVGHGGVIESVIPAVKHRPFSVGTGGVIPILVKATFHS